MGSDEADLICCGRLFQIHTPPTGKARSPYVESQVWGTDRYLDLYSASQQEPHS